MGEAKNAGPRSQVTKCQRLRVLSLNVRSATGAWAMLEHLNQRPDEGPLVVALQETRFLPSEEARFRRAACKAGFHVHLLPGQTTKDRWGATRARGGVGWLVDRRLRFRVGYASAPEDSQVVAVWAEQWLLATFYALPDPSGGSQSQNQAAELLQECLLAEGCHHWLAVGDANQSPEKSVIAETLHALQGRVFTQGEPSRWEGQEELDWVATSAPSVASPPKYRLEFLSDHKLLECSIDLEQVDLTAGSLGPWPVWTKPGAATTAWWRGTLERCWEDTFA